MNKLYEKFLRFRLKIIRANLGYDQRLLCEVGELQEQRLDEYHNPIPFDPTKKHIATSIHNILSNESSLIARIRAFTKKETKLVRRLSR